MIRHKELILSIALGFIFTLLAWQIAEHYITDFFGELSYKILRSSYMEIATHDQDGLTMRYLPGIGKLYDAETIARQAARGYDTRIDPERMQWFTKGSDWLLARLDSSSVITQPYDFPPATDKAPWISASAQSATALAIMKRAGYERNKEMLEKSISILEQLDPKIGKLSIAESDSAYWFVAHQGKPYSLYGMICVLSDLQEIFRITEIPLAGTLYLKGMRSLVSHLPELESNGYLNDNFLYLPHRSEHRKLYSMLSMLSAGYPDPKLTELIKAYHCRHSNFILQQMIANPSTKRFAGFIFVWLLLALIAYLFLKRPARNFTNDEG